jgi:hypothetical protein
MCLRVYMCLFYIKLLQKQCSSYSYVLQITAIKVADCKYGNNGECISFMINHCDLLHVMLGEKVRKDFSC